MAQPKFKGLFCRNPFDQLHIDKRGDAYFCCQAWLPVSIGNVKKTASLEEIWNSPFAQRIRESILDGSFRYCDESNCPHLQGEAGNVFKNDEIPDEGFQEFVREGKTRLDEGPRRLMVGYDPTCNLACPSCRCDYIVAKGDVLEDAESMQNRIFNSPLLNSLRSMFIPTMGEVFSSRLYRGLLRTWDRERFPNLKIEILTNGLLLTPGMWASIEKSHGVIRHVVVSVNAATPETYAKIQRGGELDKLIQNLEFIKTLRDKGLLDRFVLSFFVQADNYREMPAFVALGKRIGVDGVVFENFLNWGTYTNEEYLDRAVHLPGHPEHENFKAVIADPAMLDPIVEISNLNVFHSEFDYTIARATGPEPSRKFTFEELVYRLVLSNEQAATFRTLLDALKDKMIEIFSLPAASGEPPLDTLANLLAEPRPDEEREAIFASLMKNSIEPESGRSYYELLHLELMKIQAEITAILDTPQVNALSHLLQPDLIEVDTGYDPLATAIHARQSGAPVPKKSAADAPGESWRTLTASLGISPENEQKARKLINELKAKFAEIAARPAEGGQPAPIAFLAEQLKSGKPDATQQFLNYMFDHHPEGNDQSYIHVFWPEETRCREQLDALLGPGNMAAITKAMGDSLLDIKTGEEPLGAAIRQHAANPAADGAASPFATIDHPAHVGGITTFSGFDIALGLRPRQASMLYHWIRGLQESSDIKDTADSAYTLVGPELRKILRPSQADILQKLTVETILKLQLGPPPAQVHPTPATANSAP